MINQVDLLLRQFFLKHVPELKAESQIGFEPPNEDWRTAVANLTVDAEPLNAVNVYLVDIREQRELRSNEVQRHIENGSVRERRAAPWIELHYALSAWTPQKPSAGAVEPTLGEHQLLGSIIAVLLDVGSLVPRAIYAPTPPPAGLPRELLDVPLPVTVLPVNGFDKLGDFWNTMHWHWKPVANLLLTVPVTLTDHRGGGFVTTRIARYHGIGTPPPGQAAEERIQILGQVLDGTQTAVPRVLVMIGTIDGVTFQTTASGEKGRFTFSRLRPGNYRLRARADGLGELNRDVQVPSDEYDLRFP